MIQEGKQINIRERENIHTYRHTDRVWFGFSTRSIPTTSESRSPPLLSTFGNLENHLNVPLIMPRSLSLSSSYSSHFLFLLLIHFIHIYPVLISFSSYSSSSPLPFSIFPHLPLPLHPPPPTSSSLLPLHTFTQSITVSEGSVSEP